MMVSTACAVKTLTSKRSYYYLFLCLGVQQSDPPARLGHSMRLISLYMLLFGRKISTNPAQTHCQKYVSYFSGRRLAMQTVMSTVMTCQNMGGCLVTSKSTERHSWTARAQGTAEMNSERCSVCILLDLISPTCPCHSDTQRS